MKKFFFLSYLAFLSLCCPLPFSSLEGQTVPASHLELTINRFIMDHRFGLHALTIAIDMVGEPLVCEEKITKEIKNFLVTYPNQEDYWEIVNNKLVFFLSKLYAGYQQIESIISIEPDFTKPFNRKSVCKLVKGEIVRQAFSFSMMNLPLRNNLVNFEVNLEYDPQATLKDYVNFFTVKDAIESFIKKNDLSNIPESAIPEKIAINLLTLFPSVRGFSILLEILPHSCNSTKYSWRATQFQNK